MTTVDAAALEHVLSSVDVRLGAARRMMLDAGTSAPLAPGAVWLVFVSAGSVHGQPPLGQACSLDVDRASRAVALSPDHARDVLVEGDAFLTLGHTPITLRTDSGATLMVAELQLSDTASMLRDVLPEFISVTDFAGLEPAAARLARDLGKAEHKSLRWAENGCAPAGWPSRSNDPFLDRVVEAIHEQPGRDWTVETLAGLGAMSRSVFAERFHSALGRSPAGDLTDVRVVSAKRLRCAGGSVSDTARELGYSSDEGFSRAFRRATGMTPSRWRASRSAPVAV